ncbi:MAG: sugar transferase [Pseudomonadota bacterium]
MPLLMRAWANPLILSNTQTVQSTLINLIGVLAALMLWRRIQSFPNSHPIGAAVWSVFLVFGSVALLLLLSRLEYSRALIFATAPIALATLTVFSFVLRRNNSITLGLVPGGRLDNLPNTPLIKWARLNDADRVPECDAYVADLRFDHSADWEKRIVEFTLQGRPVYHTKQVNEHLTGRISIDHLSENSFGSVLPNSGYLAFKRLADICVVAIIGLPLLVVCAIVALCVLLKDGRPILFTQNRLGFRGQSFTMYKFRTMKAVSSVGAGCEPAELTQDGDARITALGAMLRKYRFDELPQMWNVLLGDMSLIGPRPEAEALGLHYEAKFPFYRYRYAVRPGITGWAQVSQGHVISDDDVKVKLEYDFYYVKNLSFWLDATTALKTLRVIFKGHGAR